MTSSPSPTRQQTQKEETAISPPRVLTNPRPSLTRRMSSLDERLHVYPINVNFKLSKDGNILYSYNVFMFLVFIFLIMYLLFVFFEANNNEWI